jgi:acyl-CoA synthetase (AMP-forming)/AMP-acid ligase II
MDVSVAVPASHSGSALLTDCDRPTTLPAALYASAFRSPARGLTYVGRDRSESRQSYAELVVAAERIAAGLRALGARPGERAILQLEENIDLITAFWGCVLTGVAPVVVPVPTVYRSGHAGYEKFRGVLDCLSECWIIARDESRGMLVEPKVQARTAAPRLAGIRELLSFPAQAATYIPHENDVALITLSSGTTGQPKCVMLSHRNLLARGRGANWLCEFRRDEPVLNWLPFDHIGSLADWHVRCVDLGCDAVYLSTLDVLGQPLRWLTALERYEVAHTWAPNFAFARLNEALQRCDTLPWNLSRIKTLVSAGEFVSFRTMRARPA